MAGSRLGSVQCGSGKWCGGAGSTNEISGSNVTYAGGGGGGQANGQVRPGTGGGGAGGQTNGIWAGGTTNRFWRWRRSRSHEHHGWFRWK